MSVFYRNPPYSRKASTVNKFASQFHVGDLLDMGDHIFWELGLGTSGRFCNEEGTVCAKDCKVIRDAVSPSAAEFFEAEQATGPHEQPPFYAITDKATGQPIPGASSIAPGIQYDPTSGQFWQGGPVILF